MATYDLTQQAFTLSMMANFDGAARVKGEVQALATQLGQGIDAHLQDPRAKDLIGEWYRVWGPWVWQNAGSKRADGAFEASYLLKSNQIEH